MGDDEQYLDNHELFFHLLKGDIIENSLGYRYRMLEGNLYKQNDLGWIKNDLPINDKEYYVYALYSGSDPGNRTGEIYEGK